MSKLVPSTDIIKCYNTTNQFIQMQTLPQHLYVSCITETVAQGGTRIYFNRAHNTHTCNSSGWRIPSSPMLQYLFALVNSHKYLKAYTKPKLSWSSWFYYFCFFFLVLLLAITYAVVYIRTPVWTMPNISQVEVFSSVDVPQRDLEQNGMGEIESEMELWWADDFVL